MRVIYTNDGSLEFSTHWFDKDLIGRVGEVIEIDEAEGTFEFYPEGFIGECLNTYDGIHRYFVNRAEFVVTKTNGSTIPSNPY
jgi:hypothetical protein